MTIVFTDVKKCRAVQRNHFKSNMENYSVTGLFRGNRALVQKNRKMELRSIDQNKKGKGKCCWFICEKRHCIVG